MPLELIPADRSLLRALVAEPLAALGGICANGSEIADTITGAAEATLAFYERTGADLPWISYLGKESGRILGFCSFVGAPKDDVVEIAYFTFPPYEGSGIATAMTGCLIAIARRELTLRAVIAHTLQEENASTRILTKHGFQRDGIAIDADAGEVWRWKLALKSKGRP